MVDSDRPNPLGTIASKVGVAWSAASGVIGALVTFGALSLAQGDALTATGEQLQGSITALGTVLGGILPLIAGIVASFRTSSAGKEVVTPTSDPRADDGTPLVPAPGIRARGDL